jgi:hypothetical protein
MVRTLTLRRGNVSEILAFWRSGIDEFIGADLFFKVARLCPDVMFHIVGDDDPARLRKPGIKNLVFHGFLDEACLDRLMDECKGTIRPWVSGDWVQALRSPDRGKRLMPGFERETTSGPFCTPDDPPAQR